MLSNNDRKQLKRYRHIIACLIDASIGYFTPLAALRAIQAFKDERRYCCEWYMDIAMHQFPNIHPMDMPFSVYQQINREVILDSFRYRRFRSHKRCLSIVDTNANGNESIGASWF